VFEGEVPFTKIVTDLKGFKKPKTAVMVNLGNPDLAFKVSQLPCDGVGLARMEVAPQPPIPVYVDPFRPCSRSAAINSFFCLRSGRVD
jgi:hypothetical protein